MDRAKINRIWEEAHKLAELTAIAPEVTTVAAWRQYEMDVTRQVLQLNHILLAP